MKKRFTIIMITVLCLMIALTGCNKAPNKEGAALDYPKKPVKIIVPWDAGGVSDTRVRIAAAYAEKVLGQPFAIENIGGASGTVGTRKGLDAAADGYTIISIDDATFASIVTGVADFNVDDFTYICALFDVPSVIAVRSDAPWKTFNELIEDAKRRPGEINWAISVGNKSHFLPKRIEKLTGAQFNLASHQGDSKRQAALLGGHVDVTMSYVPAGKDYMEAGEFRLLAVTSAERHPAVPDVPTLKEQGIDIVDSMIGGYAAPKGLSEDIVKVLEKAFEEASKDPELKEKLDALTLDIKFMDSQSYKKYVDEEFERLKEMAKDAGV